MIPPSYPALRGAAGFAVGISMAYVLMSFGYIFIGLTVAAAVAGASLAWKTGDWSSILVAAFGLVFGVLLGGLPIFGSFIYLAHDQPNQETVSDILTFYCIFTLGFGVVGAGFAAATGSRLVSFKTGISSFVVGGAIGGAVVVISVILPLTTGITETIMLLGLILAFLVAGALCGASQNAGKKISLSILSDHRAKLGDRSLHWRAH